jgi:hypothetical protein
MLAFGSESNAGRRTKMERKPPVMRVVEPVWCEVGSIPRNHGDALAVSEVKERIAG